MADGNIRLAPAQIAQRVGRDDDEGDLRCLLPDAGDDAGRR